MRKCFFAFLLLLTCSYAATAQRRDSVVLKTATGTIYGTLTIPAKAKTTMPVVILIAGSGPTDRNGNSGIMTNNYLRILSDSLAKYGIASLRYDKRGIGSSKAAAPNESRLRFPDYVKDVSGWVVKLRKDRRFDKVFVAGHAEGSLVGMLAVKETPVEVLFPWPEQAGPPTRWSWTSSAPDKCPSQCWIPRSIFSPS